MISFGALLGKISPTQLLVVALIETFFYSINENIALSLKITDMGGSMIIHAFGAFFGLACSKVVTHSLADRNSNNSAVYHSDLFAMVLFQS